MLNAAADSGRLTVNAEVKVAWQIWGRSYTSGHDILRIGIQKPTMVSTNEQVDTMEETKRIV